MPAIPKTSAPILRSGDALTTVAATLAAPAVLLLTAAHVAVVFLPDQRLLLLRAGLAALVILTGLVMQGWGLRLLTLLFLGGGLLMAASQGLTLRTFLGLSNMAALATLLALAPLAGFLFERRPYGKHLLAASRHWVRSRLHLHVALCGLTHVLGAMVGLAAMAIVLPLVSHSIQDEADWRTVSVALLRGYASTVLWAPAAPAVALTLDMLRQPFYTLLPVGILMVAVFAGVSLVLERRVLRSLPPLPVSEQVAEPAIVREFILASVSFVGGLMVVDYWTGVGLLTIVPLYGIAFTVVAFALRRDWTALWQRTRRFCQREIQRKGADCTVILSAGFFLAVLQNAGMTAYVQGWLQQLGTGAGAQVMLILPAMVIFLGAIGVPPTVGCAVIIGVLANVALPLPAPLLAATLSAGVLTVHLAGPISIPNFMLTSLTGQSLIKTGMGWNWQMSLVNTAVVLTVLELLLWLW